MLKIYAWEEFYAEKVKGLRKQELKAVRKAACVVSFFESSALSIKLPHLYM